MQERKSDIYMECVCVSRGLKETSQVRLAQCTKRKSEFMYSLDILSVALNVSIDNWKVNLHCRWFQNQFSTMLICTLFAFRSHFRTLSPFPHSIAIFLMILFYPLWHSRSLSLSLSLTRSFALPFVLSHFVHTLTIHHILLNFSHVCRCVYRLMLVLPMMSSLPPHQMPLP